MNHVVVSSCVVITTTYLVPIQFYTTCKPHIYLRICMIRIFFLMAQLAMQEMSTLVKSGTLWFSDYHKRWLTAPEALTCQGFPIDKELSYNTPCCSWAMRTAGLSEIKFPSRGVTIGQAGNSMHTEVVATMISFCLLESSMGHMRRQMFNLGFARAVGNLRPSANPTAEDESDDGGDDDQMSPQVNLNLHEVFLKNHTHKSGRPTP